MKLFKNISSVMVTFIGLTALGTSVFSGTLGYNVYAETIGESERNISSETSETLQNDNSINAEETTTLNNNEADGEIKEEKAESESKVNINAAGEKDEKQSVNGDEGTSGAGITQAPKVLNGFVKSGSSWIYYNNGVASSAQSDIVHGVLNGSDGWWYIEKGKAVLTKTSVEHNINGWWYVKNGKVDFNYNGFASNKNGWWYIEGGKVSFTKNDVIQGTVNKENAWWNVKGSKVIFNESIEQNINGWWYIKDGKVDFTKTGVEHNINGWWYVKNGKVDFNYNGIASNKNGTWYIVNGKVDFNANGWKTVKDKQYYVVNGKVTNTKGAVSQNVADLSGKIFSISSSSNGNLVIAVMGSSIDPGSNVKLYESNKSSNNSRFRFEKLSDGYYKIIAIHSEMALGVSGTNAVQNSNNNSDSIKWEVLKNADSTYSFKNKYSGTYLSIEKTANDSNVSTIKTNSAAAQKFKLLETAYSQAVKNACYRILTGNGSYAFDVIGANPSNGTKVQSYAKNSSPAQLFKIEYAGNGFYTLKTGASIYASAIDVTDSKFAAGTKLQQNKINNGNSQKWRILTDGKKYVFMSAGGRYVIDVTDAKYSGGQLQLAAYSKPVASDTFSLEKASGWLIRDGRKYYFNQNGDKPMIGIDVSAWSEDIDWDKVKADGIEFALIRTAHRGDRIDPYGERNMKECERVGIPYGVYFYSIATTEQEADAEIKVFLKSIEGHNPKLGMFLDIEDNSTYEEAFGDIYSANARRKITDIAKRMISKIKAAGYTAGIYGNEEYMKHVIYLDEMPDIRWVARYFTNTASDQNVISLDGMKYKIWQFTDRGNVDGLPNSGGADLNTLIEKYW